MRHLTVGGLGGLMLLSLPSAGVLPPPHLLVGGNSQIQKDTDQNAILADELQKIMPPEVRALNMDEENKISEKINEINRYRDRIQKFYC